MKKQLLATLLSCLLLQSCGYDYFIRKYGKRVDSTEVSIPYSQKIEGVTDEIEVPRGTLTFPQVTGSKGAKLSATNKAKLNPTTGRVDTVTKYEIICPDSVIAGTAKGKAPTQIITEDKPGILKRAWNTYTDLAGWLLILAAILYFGGRFLSNRFTIVRK